MCIKFSKGKKHKIVIVAFLHAVALIFMIRANSQNIKWLFLFFFIAFLSCLEEKKLNYIEIEHYDFKNDSISENKNIDFWIYKDIINDKLPGISLYKAFDNFLKNKINKKVIIALIDTEVDFRHPVLSEHIWINADEIENNGKDDDQNGYVDDIHGWNFIGNSAYENTEYVHLEYVRIINKYDSLFSNMDSLKIPNDLMSEFGIYKKAKELHRTELENSKFYIEQGKLIKEKYRVAREKLSHYFDNENYDLNRLDSLKGKQPELSNFITLISNYTKYNITEEDIDKDLENYQNHIDKYLNLSYNEREIIGDNPKDLEDKNYGNNHIIKPHYEMNHGTLMAGVLVDDSKGKFSKCIDKIKIMPLSISSKGDEHDKDIALAIRYAVDNGAEIINFSSGKQFSVHNDWVTDALKYANDNNVLFITSAGNENSFIDFKSFAEYPNDNFGDNNGNEIVENLIMVGNSTYDLKNLREISSNFSQEHVDLFAPGTEVMTTSKNNSFEKTTGTSVSAAVVSKIAAFILSYYPDLSAYEIKNILMDSGLSYNIDVEITQEDGTKKMVPFSSLSKSGKIVNAYNALLMAEQMSKAKK